MGPLVARLRSWWQAERGIPWLASVLVISCGSASLLMLGACGRDDECNVGEAECTSATAVRSCELRESHSMFPGANDYAIWVDETCAQGELCLTDPEPHCARDLAAIDCGVSAGCVLSSDCAPGEYCDVGDSVSAAERCDNMLAPASDAPCTDSPDSGQDCVRNWYPHAARKDGALCIPSAAQQGCCAPLTIQATTAERGPRCLNGPACDIGAGLGCPVNCNSDVADCTPAAVDTADAVPDYFCIMGCCELCILYSTCTESPTSGASEQESSRTSANGGQGGDTSAP